MMDELMSMATMMSPEEFYEFFNFEIPASNAEWDIIATEGIPMYYEDVTGFVTIDNQNIALYIWGELNESTYVINDDSIISLVSNTDWWDSFTIVEVDETNLILSTSITIDGITGNDTYYFSK
jgi:hypothetical protein